MPAELSGPSQLAFRWAWARAGGAAPGAGTVGSLDLLAGILLAHVADSEPRQLLDHFGIPYGAVLGAAGARRYDGNGLLAAVRRLPADALPPLEPDVERILARAREAPDPDGLVPLRALFGALLELDNPASAAIRRELAARGADAAAIVASYRDFLTSQQPYGTFLRDRHPCPPPRVEVPAYQADKPLAEPDDLVGISAEVDAFAYLIASRALEPPLAIGLFGDWGSGKSFFLRSLQRRIDGLVTAPVTSQRGLPFYTHIVQIEFNAWQYVEGNLWASLVEHVFRNLRTCADDDLVAQRQDHWIERLKVTDERRERLHAQRDRLEQQRQAAIEEIARIRAKPLATLTKAAKGLVHRAGLPMVAEAQELRAALAEARDVLHQANPLLEPLRRGGWRSAAVVVLAVALTPAVIWATGQLDVSRALETASILASVLASAAAYLRRGTSIVQDGLTEIAQAQEQLDEVEAQLDDATARERELALEAERIEAELAGVTPASVLAEFLAERTGSDDYRRHLGVPALVRRDLERLSNLVDQQNRRLEGGQAPRDGEYPINRIVLYIDDLDRCPTELVIQVLQAVHLLLAFPLFVVVVAVDARWLAGSLREHYGRLLADGASPDSATPDDYLEKIFQVPFWVQPLGAETRRRLVRGLLTPSLAAEAPEPAASGEAPAPDPIEEVDPGFFALVDALFDTEAPNPAWLEAARLEITEQELALIDEVAPLLGDTPRSVKRFANVYQLVKSMRRSRPQPTDGAVILLLAIATGLPDLARALLGAVERHHTGPFALDEVVKDRTTAQHAQLANWLTEHPDFKTLDTPDLPGWTALIRRFSFRLGDRPSQ
ncbi:MAG: P-loop NTPase fold protein [Egibacteraceae bacterium]